MRICLPVSCPSLLFLSHCLHQFSLSYTLSAAHTKRERIGTSSTFSTFFTFPFEGLNLSPQHTHTHTHKPLMFSHQWPVMVVLYVFWSVPQVVDSIMAVQWHMMACQCVSFFLFFICRCTNLHLFCPLSSLSSSSGV